MTTADISLLGPVRIVGPDGPAQLVGGRQRVLVALLALNAGAVVSRSQLIDALWGEDPPRTAVRTLQSHVTRVRQALRACGLAEVLIAKEPGYLLDVGRQAVDALRFEDLVREARAGQAVEKLRAALELWHGDVAADAVADLDTGGWASRELDRLQELRLTALEELWDAELRLGHHRAAVDELDRLLARWPSRERLVALFMLALYRCGRSADALDRFERFRTLLAEELGADPGPELRQLHTAVLRNDPELDLEVTFAHPVPAQLPPPVGHFTGRDDHLAELAVLPPERIMLVCGPAGVGKTALMVQWAHQVKDRFPDGQVYLDLFGHDPATALSTVEILTHVLLGMGVPGDRVPAGQAEQVALYRSLVHGKRMLLVLDNAGTADQVLALVPGGTDSVLAVTSRRRLVALALHHAVRVVEVSVLDVAGALDVVDRIVGAGRVTAEPVAAHQLVELCDRLPLALRIAAAKLAGQPRRRIADLVSELSGADRLDALSVDGDSYGVRTVFAGAYQSLSEPAVHLLRLLGTHPGTTFTTELAAALAGLPHGRARRGIDELAAAHLIVDHDDHTGGRYRFHDLIRLYAAECARAEETPDALAEVRDREFDWYLAVAHGANHVLDPARNRVTIESSVNLPFAATRPAALAFLDGEHANLMAIIRHGSDQAKWRLCYLLAGYFESHGHHRDRITAYRLGLDAAVRLGDKATEALMRSGLGIACFAARAYPEALEHFTHALELAIAGGDRRAEGHVRSNIAAVLGASRRYDDAIEAGEQALAVHTANGHNHGITLALNNLGCAHARAGRPEPALRRLADGLALARADGDPRLEAAILHSMGEAHRHAGQFAAAFEKFDAALALRRRQGDRYYEVDTLNELGLTQLGADGHASALRTFTEARTLNHLLGDEHLDAVLLAGLGEAQLGLGDFAAAGEVLTQARTLRARIPDADEEARISSSLATLAALTPSSGSWVPADR